MKKNQLTPGFFEIKAEDVPEDMRQYMPLPGNDDVNSFEEPAGWAIDENTMRINTRNPLMRFMLIKALLSRSLQDND